MTFVYLPRAEREAVISGFSKVAFELLFQGSFGPLPQKVCDIRAAKSTDLGSVQGCSKSVTVWGVEVSLYNVTVKWCVLDSFELIQFWYNS